MNYLENYRCSSCSVSGMKLWRPIHGLSGWLCVNCATFIEHPRLKAETDRHLLAIWPFDADGVFTFSAGDQLGDMLPAVPTADGTEVYGYGAVPEERARWWHEMPTHADAALEVRCLRNLFLRSAAQLHGMTDMYLRSVRKLNEMRGGRERSGQIVAQKTDRRRTDVDARGLTRDGGRVPPRMGASVRNKETMSPSRIEEIRHVAAEWEFDKRIPAHHAARLLRELLSRIDDLERTIGQMRLLAGLPLPPDVVAKLVEADNLRKLLDDTNQNKQASMRCKRDATPLAEVDDLVLDVLIEHSWGSCHRAATTERQRRDAEMQAAEAAREET